MRIHENFIVDIWAGLIYNFLRWISTIKLPQYIHIIDLPMAFFHGFRCNFNFEYQTIIKDFTNIFVNKHKVNRISDQSKVPITYLFIVRFSKFKALLTVTWLDKLCYFMPGVCHCYICQVSITLAATCEKMMRSAASPMRYAVFLMLVSPTAGKRSSHR